MHFQLRIGDPLAALSEIAGWPDFERAIFLVSMGAVISLDESAIHTSALAAFVPPSAHARLRRTEAENQRITFKTYSRLAKEG